jgi:hypothetical protein
MIPTVLPQDFEPLFPEYQNIPASINGIPFEDFIASLESCLDSKGTAYYKKIVGGMRCSNIELVKLELIIYLLKRYTKFPADEKANTPYEEYEASTCMYNGTQFPGMVYTGQNFSGNEVEISILSSETYLQTFVKYASKFCKDCITSDPVPAPVVPASTAGNLYGENGTTPITLENGGTIIL